MKQLTWIGRQFGRLTVIKETVAPITRKWSWGTFWLCRCECGQETIVHAGDLKRGRARSCRPCAMKKVCEENVTHGHSRGGIQTPEYRAWIHMRERCYRKKSEKYHLWGGRGVRVCAKWRNNFAAFLADVGPRPTSKHSLDRYPNNDGHYEPGNVRWATTLEQCHNRRGSYGRKSDGGGDGG